MAYLNSFDYNKYLILICIEYKILSIFTIFADKMRINIYLLSLEVNIFSNIFNNYVNFLEKAKSKINLAFLLLILQFIS